VAAALPLGSEKSEEYDLFLEGAPQYIIQVNRKDVSKITVIGKTGSFNTNKLHQELLETRKIVGEQRALLEKSNEIIQRLINER
jgi:hypothetical protein